MGGLGNLQLDYCLGCTTSGGEDDEDSSRYQEDKFPTKDVAELGKDYDDS